MPPHPDTPCPTSGAPVGAASPSSVLGAWLDLLVPARCHHCNGLVQPGRWSPFLCPCCAARMPGHVHRRPPLVGAGVPVWSLGVLEGPLQTLVHVAKYRGNPAAGRRLGLALGVAAALPSPTARRAGWPEGGGGSRRRRADRFPEAAHPGKPGTTTAADGVVPVPLHWWRRWRRGHDQARVLARGVAAAAGSSCWPALRRRRATRPQVGLGERARARNLRDAFAARGRWRARLAGARVLLVDDVVTTGATLRAAHGALRRAGAELAGVLTAAWMPSPE